MVLLVLSGQQSHRFTGLEVVHPLLKHERMVILPQITSSVHCGIDDKHIHRGLHALVV